jgi:hypothetical protein
MPTETASPTPTPILPFAAPRLKLPNSGEYFHGSQNILLEWEPVGRLAFDEWYFVSLRYWKGTLQYSGDKVKEPSWIVRGEIFYGQADLASGRRYEWDVTVVRITYDAQGNETSTPLSPVSETREFFWP